MTTPQQEAKSITCERCGAAFFVARLEPALQCPFCHHVQALQPKRLQELRQHQAQIQHHQLGAMQHELVAGTQLPPLPALSAPEGRRLVRLLIVCELVAIGFVAVLVITSQVLLHGLAIAEWNETLMVTWPVLTLICMAFGALGAWAFWHDQQKSATQRAGTLSTCPKCGAPNALAPGRPVTECSHCGVSLLPSAQQMQADHQAAAQRHTNAARQSQVIAWRDAQDFARSRRKGGTPGNIFMLFVWLPVGAIFAAIATPASAQPALRIAIQVLAWTALVALPLGLAVLTWLRHRRRRSQWRKALDALAATTHGHASTSPGSLVTWLGAHWNGPYSAPFLACGDYYGSVSCRLRNHEVLVDVDPGSWLRTGRLHILVAPRPAYGSPAPSNAAPSPAAHHAAAQLSQQGFPVRFEPAGLLAPAQPRLVSRFSAHPAETAHLATTAAELVALAELLES